MGVLDRLAGALARNDERPNVELAEALAATPDRKAIAELAGALASGPQAIRNDAIKVLYELGERRPELISPHVDAFFDALRSPNNRMVWGAMSALAAVATHEAAALMRRLPDILAAADKGSVIAKDKAMSILAQLALAGHRGTALGPLLERLETAAPNQFPMYAELALPAVDTAHRARFRAILEQRTAGELPRAKRARIEKVLRRLAK